MKTKTYETGENRVLKYNKKEEVITICDNKTGKEAVFTPARWASFRLYMDEVDDQLNSLSQDRYVDYCAHNGGGWRVSVNTGYRCVDWRKWSVPFAKTERKPTRTGIALRLPNGLCSTKRSSSYTATTRTSSSTRHALSLIQRPNDLHGRQPVSVHDVNSSSMRDFACLWHYGIDGLNADSICLCCVIKHKHDICSILCYLTQHPKHHNTVKSSIAGKVSQKTRQTNVSTAKNTEPHAIMSTEPTDGTL